ncbi:MAG: hypothetical protein IT160_19565 [Bryobacterales bacterium]|nr:hypothetical protein [Bryobacterales bacterium]
MNRIVSRALPALLAAVGGVQAQRVSVPLDGVWQIEDSVSPSDPPRRFTRTVPVPGLANLAVPAFADVDRFDSRELISSVKYNKHPPADAPLPPVGTPRQERNYFWYRRTFRVSSPKPVAILKIAKAQFGTAVWLNGKKLGDHDGCFTAGYFDASAAIRRNAENELLVRIGAHPAVVDPRMAVGTDFEKLKWTPGIYDSVVLLLAGSPVIESVQVAPRLSSSSILVQTVLHNYGPAGTFSLKHVVRTWRGAKVAATPAPLSMHLAAGETRTFEQSIPLPQAHLWSPEDPFLYTLSTSTPGDDAATRFGMRELRFDRATRRAYLNGKPYFLRGSNITLHRFFEDPACKRLPWDEKWVRRLLAEIPKTLHWNSFRFCIGPVPDRWLDIADEAGLLIQNEFPIWTGGKGWNNWHAQWDPDLLIGQFREWMRDNWNHPSVVIWDACNETLAPVLGEKVIPAVRGLDLSGRPFDNGFNPPAGPDDPVEDHPYLFIKGWHKKPGFRMTELETMTGGGPDRNYGHAGIINEYGWLWLLRDGSPTPLTRNVYEDLLGNDSTKQQRFELNAYYLAGLTEFWRSHRNHAGVLHFVYLTCSYAGAFTSDHFRDINTLELEPHFADWVGQAFKPLGVYINFWQPKLAAGGRRTFAVTLINDDPVPVSGKLTLALESSASTAARSELPFRLPPSGREVYTLALDVPSRPGEYLLKASAAARGTEPTLSRRKIAIE